MSLLGTQLLVWAGSTLPTPVGSAVIRRIQSVQVVESVRGLSGFRIGFHDGPEMDVFGALARVVISVVVGARPTVLMDGVVTRVDHVLSRGGTTRMGYASGEDLSVLMDMDEVATTFPGHSDPMVASRVLLKYARYGVVPRVQPPQGAPQPSPLDPCPVQRETDRALLVRLAAKYGYDFYLAPNPVPLTSTAWWGPPSLVSLPQPALTVNLGAATNVNDAEFGYDALAATKVDGTVQRTGSTQSVDVDAGRSTWTPLSARPALRSQSRVRTMLAEGLDPLSIGEARARVQGAVNRSTETAVVGRGTVQAERYGGVLRARSLVGVRGAGRLFDGTYYVRSVEHRVERGSYTQTFTVARDGTRSTTPVVRP